MVEYSFANRDPSDRSSCAATSVLFEPLQHSSISWRANVDNLWRDDDVVSAVKTGREFIERTLWNDIIHPASYGSDRSGGATAWTL